MKSYKQFSRIKNIQFYPIISSKRYNGYLLEPLFRHLQIHQYNITSILFTATEDQMLKTSISNTPSPC